MEDVRFAGRVGVGAGQSQHLFQNDESGHDDAGALRVEAHRSLALFQRLGGQTLLDGPQLIGSDDGLVHAGGVVGFHSLANAHDARGRTGHGHHAIDGKADVGQAFEIRRHGLANPLTGRVHLARRRRIVVEEPLRHATAADIEGAGGHRIGAEAPSHHLRRTATDIDDEQLLVGEIAGGAQERELRLTGAGDHRQRDAALCQAGRELRPVFGIAGGGGGHGDEPSHGMLGSIVACEHLQVAIHAGEHPLDSRLGQAPRSVHAHA